LYVGDIIMQEAYSTTAPNSPDLLPLTFGGIIVVGVVLAALLLAQRRRV